MPPRQNIFASVVLAACLAAINPFAANADQKRATVRVTTGTVVINGWEKSLVQGNPNLGHWHWDPICTNVTGNQVRTPWRGANRGGPGPQGKFIPAAPPRHFYPKPIHEAFNLVRKPQTPYITLPEHKKPSAPYITLPEHKAPSAPYIDVNALLAQKETKAKLAQRDTNAMLARKDTSAMLAHKDTSAMLAQNKVSATLAQQNVSAQLADRQVNASLMNKSVCAQLQPTAYAPPRVATYGGRSNDASGDFAYLSDQGYRKESASAVGQIVSQKRSAAKSTHKQNSHKPTSGIAF